MESLNKNILIVSPESWQHIFVSKHHYAVHLAKRGNQVYFLNPPSQSVGLLNSEYKGVFEMNYKGFWAGLRFLPGFLQRININKVFLTIEKVAGVQFDIIWSFDNSVFFDFKGIPKRTFKICHIVDLNQNFQFVKAAKSADICFTPSTIILKKLLSSNANSHFINHGLSVDYEEAVFKLPGTGGLKALYFGNLTMPYLDWEIIEQAGEENQDVDFIFIGSNPDNCDLSINPMHVAKERLHALDNFYFLPKVKSRMLLGYMKSADVLMVAYQQKFHMDQSNPHKMMEYLFSGKPIVATFTEEYQQYRDAIQMSDDNSYWPILFSETVKNIGFWTDTVMSERRKQIALSNTYDYQLDKIFKLING